MPVVVCPACGNPVTLSDPWPAATFSCPHCRRTVPVPRTTPVPPPPPPPSSFDDVDEEPSPRVPRRHRPSGNSVGDFLTFRLMVTPLLIQVVFWVGTAACLITGGRMMMASFDSDTPSVKSRDSGTGGSEPAKRTSSSDGPSVSQFAYGLVVALVGPLLIRIACELDIILFRIHDELKAANDRESYRSRD